MARVAHAHAKPVTGSFRIAGYSFEDLHEIRKQIDAEIASRKAGEIKALRVKITEGAHALGISIEEILGIRAKRETKHAKGKLPPKYRGPSGEEWSGKGPAPKWMKPLLAKGKTKADFLIK